MLINLRDKMNRLNGVITPEAIDRLKDELGSIFTVVKMHHYKQGQKYGHLASAISEVKYRMLEPAELTLNLLRQSHITPNISAYAHIHGPHDYMRKPMAPLGCAIQAHVKPDDRCT